MAYSNSSSAYDLSAYENVPKARKEKQVKLRVVKSRKRATFSTLLSPRVFSSFAVVITLVCLIVYNQARMTEITGRISSINDQIERLESEYIVMESRMESAISLRTIEELAQHELGMQKRDSFNTEYVYLYESDRIHMPEGAAQEGVMQKAKVALNSAVNALKEYIAEQ